MGRRDVNGSDTSTIVINDFLGVNTDTQFSQIDIRQSPDMQNLIPGRIKGLRHRAGTKLITQTPRVGGLTRMFPFRKSGVSNIVASGGTTLYKFDTIGLDWDAQTMTNSFLSANINAVQYRDDTGNEVLVIADGSTLKKYDGTAVSNITPAANDSSPLPPNGLANINSTNPAQGITTHNNRLVLWNTSKDIIYHSKPGFFDYYPTTHFQRFVKNSDTVQTCISFGSALLVFMRNSVGVLFGDGYNATPQTSDWSQDFLDTTDGCVNPRSVQVVVFPDSTEQVFYQTDKGVSAVMNIATQSLDNSTRFATRDVTENKVRWDGLGLTNAQWQSAVSSFSDGKYWLTWFDDGVPKGMVYSTTNDQWYFIKGVTARDYLSNQDAFYFVDDSGHLKAFDDTKHFDYTDFAQTTGPAVEWYWYSKLLNPQLTGFEHFWDILMIEAQQFNQDSRIDVEINGLTAGSSAQFALTGAVQTSIMIIGVSIIGQAQIANTQLTDIINNAKRIRVFLKSQYIQIKLFNNDGMPVELYNLLFETRPQLTY